MKKYTVIPLSMGGLGNKIFKAGETVTEANFPKGNIDRLVKEGFLKEISEPKAKKKK